MAIQQTIKYLKVHQLIGVIIIFWSGISLIFGGTGKSFLDDGKISDEEIAVIGLVIGCVWLFIAKFAESWHHK